MIRNHAIWLATTPLDMRAGADGVLARIVQVFGAAHAHTVYLFANSRANRMKVLVHDGIGIWLAARDSIFSKCGASSKSGAIQDDDFMGTP